MNEGTLNGRYVIFPVIWPYHAVLVSVDTDNNYSTWIGQPPPPYYDRTWHLGTWGEPDGRTWSYYKRTQTQHPNASLTPQIWRSNGAWWDTAPSEGDECVETRVVPIENIAFLDKSEDFALGHDCAGEV